MTVRATTAFVAFAALLATEACRRDTPWPPEPAAIHFGEDACSACSMIISDPIYAAEIVEPKGTVQLFDDIGCMLTKTTTSVDPVGVFVRASDGSRWIRGDQAYILRSEAISSPMGYGLAAFAARSDAEAAALAHEGSVVVELTSLMGGNAPRPLPLRGQNGPELSLKGEIGE